MHPIKNLAYFVTVAALALAIPCDADAADADLQQYNRLAADVETACGADPLTSSLLLPVDG